jgi:hypothetical protein
MNKLVELHKRKVLGKQIRSVVNAFNKERCNMIPFYFLTDMVVLDINVLGATFSDRIGSNEDKYLIIAVDRVAVITG